MARTKVDPAVVRPTCPEHPDSRGRLGHRPASTPGPFDEQPTGDFPAAPVASGRRADRQSDPLQGKTHQDQEQARCLPVKAPDGDLTVQPL